MTDTKILDRIQALLNKAESTTFPEEAKAFTAKAQELMIKWQIDEAQLAVGRTLDAAEVGITSVFMPYSPYQGPKHDLLARIARQFNCRIVHSSGSHAWHEGERRRGTKIDVVGFTTDRQRTMLLFHSLLLQADIELVSPAVRGRMFAETSHPGHRLRWRNAFMVAFNSEVQGRLIAQRVEADRANRTADTGVALVLRDRSKAVQEYMGGAYGKLGRGRGPSLQGHGGGAKAGREAGRRADLAGDARFKSSERRALR